MTEQLTYGQKVANVNSFQNEEVRLVKNKFADLIDKMNDVRHSKTASSDAKRYAEFAIVELECNISKVVKALTFDL